MPHATPRRDGTHAPPRPRSLQPWAHAPPPAPRRAPQEYCELRDFSYEKIDSCLFGSELESAVRRFDEGKVGVCLFWTLHTGMMGGKRAGKDTCIFYESGINEPQVETDLVLRLVTENTIEDREMKNPNKRIRQVRSASTISDAELARILDGSGKAAESGAGSAR